MPKIDLSQLPSKKIDLSQLPSRQNTQQGTKDNFQYGTGYTAFTESVRKRGGDKSSESIESKIPLPSVTKSISNIPKDIGEIVGGIKEVVSHPVNTLKGLAGLTVGGITQGVRALGLDVNEEQLAKVNDFLSPEVEGEKINIDSEEQFKSVLSSVLETVSDPQKLKKVVEENPVDTALLFTSMLTGIKKLTTAKATEEVGSLSKVDNITPSVIEKAPAVSEVVEKPRVVSNAVRDMSDYVISQTSGIAPDSVKFIKSNPEIYDLARNGTLTREALGNKVLQAIDTKIDDLSETGKAYDGIRSTQKQIVVPRDDLRKIIEDKGLIVGENGITESSKLSSNLSDADISAVNKAWQLFDGIDEVTPAQVLNLRNKVDALINWKTDVTPKGAAIVKQIRGKIDEVAKKEVPDLKRIDEQYGAQITELNQLKKDYIDPKTGALKDTALSKIANLSNKGREQILSRLEEVLPGITKEIQGLKAFEDVTNAFGQKVGAYVKGMVAATGVFGVATGNPALIAAAVITNPSVMSFMLRQYGKIRKGLSPKIDTIIKKIEAGTELTVGEKSIIGKMLRDNVKLPAVLLPEIATEATKLPDIQSIGTTKPQLQEQ